MPQMHFYVPEALANELKRRALASGKSTSRYLADLVRSQIDSGWPAGYTTEVLGCWNGEPLERPPPLEVERRQSL